MSTTASTTGTRAVGPLRRYRGGLVVALAALAAVVAAVLLGGRPATSTPLDPDNPGADGARAVARVLDDQGVEVRVVRGADALDAESLDPSTTVLVTSSYLLGQSTAQRLLDHLSGADLVVAEPGPGVVDALGLSAESWTVAPGADRPAGCADPLYAGLEVRVDVGTEFTAPAGCFTGEHGHLVAEPQAGVTLLGASALLTNDQVLRADNAAVALRLLGQHDRLVWYVPEAGDLLGRDGVSLRTLVPDWILPGLWIAGATVLALLLWRVRRLGPLVVEPLPVTVKAIETTQSRGRLYRKSGDRAHAARALRAGRAGRADRAAAPAAGHRRARARRRPAHRPARRRRPRADRRRRALPRHRRRPDHPGRRAGPAPTRGTPMTTTPEPGVPTSPADAPAPASDESRERLAAVRAEVAKAVVGQDAAVSGLLVALLCGGHVLMEGVPGVAKTLLVRSLAGALAVQTRRVQFTPDLMPGDITGSMVIDSRQGELSFREGPLFTNLLLADEINRTPPKTQSALLEAMEEGQVSVDGVSRPLPRPFLVAATQNPVEYEGTYPLPEAQLDRFLLKVVLPIPPREAELEILRRHAEGFDPRDIAAAGVTAVCGPEDIAAGQAAVRRVQVSPEVTSYIVDIARATRESPSLSLGVSPRGATALMRSARAWAWLTGRDFVTPDDVKALAQATLAHRLGLRPEAELEGVQVGQVLDSALGSVPVPR